MGLASSVAFCGVDAPLKIPPRPDDETIVPRAGDTILIPSFKKHLGEFLTDEVVLVSVFVPRREEFGPQGHQAPRLSFLADGA